MHLTSTETAGIFCASDLIYCLCFLFFQSQRKSKLAVTWKNMSSMCKLEGGMIQRAFHARTRRKQHNSPPKLLLSRNVFKMNLLSATFLTSSRWFLFSYFCNNRHCNMFIKLMRQCTRAKRRVCVFSSVVRYSKPDSSTVSCAPAV